MNPGNVIVPTAVESHIANATLSLAGLAFELFYFSGELAMGLAIY